MPIITHVLLYLAYLTISLTVALALNEVGAQDLGSSFLGGIALFCACAVTHSSIAATAAAGRAGAAEKTIKRDMDRLRTAHREVTADIDAMQTRLDHMETSIAYGTPAQAPQIEATPNAPQLELKMIDQIVDKLGAAMDARLQNFQTTPNVTPLNPTAARGPMDLVRDALMENRVELYLQPIVQLPQRKTAFYEGFTRLKDANGRLILPQEFIPAAEQAGLMSTIDNVLLSCAARSASSRRPPATRRVPLPPTVRARACRSRLRCRWTPRGRSSTSAVTTVHRSSWWKGPSRMRGGSSRIVGTRPTSMSRP
jgi:cyclic-di-GMP phosphodiesterase TipF (flagellum assembly factor)